MCLYRGNDQHANGHTDRTSDEKELASKAVNGPSSVEGEEDSESGIESINQSNLRSILEYFLVHDSAVCVKRSLAGDLLASVEDERKIQPLTDRLIFPESGVAAGDGFFLELDSLADD